MKRQLLNICMSIGAAFGLLFAGNAMAQPKPQPKHHVSWLDKAKHDHHVLKHHPDIHKDHAPKPLPPGAKPLPPKPLPPKPLPPGAKADPHHGKPMMHEHKPVPHHGKPVPPPKNHKHLHGDHPHR